MQFALRDPQKFQQHIFSWWKTNRRDLPWRRTHEPYRILVSEVMLQQTQVSRVLVKYQEFLNAFPTVKDLANASPAAVLRLWKGMGYNRRALYLKKAAEIVVNRYKGIFPKDEHLLTQLPGLGKYTARAILVFAYKKDIAPVDTNIRQIITHFFFKDIAQSERVIQEAADILVPRRKSWEWNQALMDYGALELSKIKRPKKINKQATPFKETNRFFRGRVMDILREKDMNELDLIDEFTRKYDRSEDFMRFVIAGLEKDALILRKKGVISLPS